MTVNEALKKAANCLEAAEKSAGPLGDTFLRAARLWLDMASLLMAHEQRG